MKDLLFVFVILVVLLMIIATVGGSLKFTGKREMFVNRQVYDELQVQSEDTLNAQDADMPYGPIKFASTVPIEDTLEIRHKVVYQEAPVMAEAVDPFDVEDSPYAGV